MDEPLEGCGTMAILLRVDVPPARPTRLAHGLVAVSFGWSNFLWPPVITSPVETRPLTVGLAVFAPLHQGIDRAIIRAATPMTSAPLLLGFLCSASSCSPSCAPGSRGAPRLPRLPRGLYNPRTRHEHGGMRA